VLRLGSRDVIDVRVAPIPGGPGILYFLLAGVGTFTLLVGGAVRLRRPRDPATLHFLWLSVAFFGVFTFSFSGRLDRLDWVFFWADEVSILALPPLFLHFTLVFPERSSRLSSTGLLRVLGGPQLHAGDRTRPDPSGVAGGRLHRRRAVRPHQHRARSDGVPLPRRVLHRRAGRPDAGAAARPYGHGTAAAALDRLGHRLRRRSVCVRLRAAYALGVTPSLPMQLSAIPLSLIPLAYASAIVRYRLMDVEVSSSERWSTPRCCRRSWRCTSSC
jgi:hypothetical protein